MVRLAIRDHTRHTLGVIQGRSLHATVKSGSLGWKCSTQPTLSPWLANLFPQINKVYVVLQIVDEVLQILAFHYPSSGWGSCGSEVKGTWLRTKVEGLWVQPRLPCVRIAENLNQLSLMLNKGSMDFGISTSEPGRPVMYMSSLIVWMWCWDPCKHPHTHW